MADFGSLPLAITGIKTSIEIVKAIKDADHSLDKAELKFKIADLTSSLADVKSQLADVKELIEAKDREIRQLQQSAEMRDKVKRIGDAYFKVDAEGAASGDPYCPVCVELGKPPIHISADFDYFVCGACGNMFQGQRVREAEHMR